MATVAARRSQSMVPFVSSPFTKLARFIEPRLQDSHGSSGCSPQGLVLSICPSSGVGFELVSFMRSMKTIPGSPLAQADSTMEVKTSLALSVPAASLLRGLIMSKLPPVSTAFMNLSSRAMEMLKFSSTPACDFIVIKSLISGCQ